jgi:hypothetical protein
MRGWAKGLLIWGLAGIVAGASSCSSLPDIDRNVCGNGVVEPGNGEDCDDGITDDAGHQTCYPSGSVAACHFDCSSSACPAGFSCGNDAVCRKPSGIFKDTGHATQIDADHLLTGDFDHDGLGDVIAQTAVQMNVLFGDGTGALSDPFTIRATNATPAVGLLALDPDGGAASEPYTDLVFSALEGVTTWRGRQDRTLAPTPYPSLQLGAQEARVIEAKVLAATQDILVYSVAPNDPSTSVLATAISGQATDFRDIFWKRTGSSVLPSTLVGDIAVANLNDSPASPCDELAFAFAVPPSSAGASPSPGDRVTVLTTCTDPVTRNSFDDQSSAISPPIPPLDVLLPLGVVTRTNGLGVRTGDLDGDGHLDLFVDAQLQTLLGDAGAGGTSATYVAYGLGDGTFSSSPMHAPVDNRFSHLIDAQLLAVGQLTSASDPFPDFVFSNGIVLDVAAPSSGDAGATLLSLPPIVPDQAWVDARIADLDGDGFPDMVGGSVARVDLYRSSSAPGVTNLTPVHYAVDGNASEFAIGDFDGDRVSDIALRSNLGNNTADLDVMWGSYRGAPADPFVVGRFGNIRSIGTGVIANVLGNDDSVGDLGVVIEATDGSFALSVLAGSTDRQLQAPFFIEQQAATAGTTLAAPLGFSVGQLTAGDRHADIVAGTAISRGDAGSFSLRDAGSPTDIELAIAQSTGAAQLSSDSSLLKFSNRLDTFGASATCTTGLGCNLPIANWQQLALVTADLDGQLDGGVPGNGVDEIIGIAPALATGNVKIDQSAVGQIFWARFDGLEWKVQTTGLGVVPAKGATPLAALAAADVNGDGNTDVLALISNANVTSQTTLLAYINTANGQLPTKTTVISLPSYATDPDAPFQIVGIAPIDADDQPGKEIAMLTDAGGLFLAKSNAAGDAFTVTGPLCDNGALSLCADQPSQRIPSGQAIAAVDVDGDGIQDLILESSSTLRVYKGTAVDP